MSDKRIELAETLIELTSAGSIDWEILSADDTVVANLGNGRIVLTRSSVGSSVDIVVRVYDPQGNIAEEFTDVTLTQLSGEHFRWFTRLNETLETARRKALGADDLLASIINELKTGIPF